MAGSSTGVTFLYFLVLNHWQQDSTVVSKLMVSKLPLVICCSVSDIFVSTYTNFPESNENEEINYNYGLWLATMLDQRFGIAGIVVHVNMEI